MKEVHRNGYFIFVSIIIIIIIPETYAVGITKRMEYIENKEVPLIQIVRTQQHDIHPALLQTARRLKTELQTRPRQMRDSIAEKTKDRWRGRGCIDNSHVTWKKTCL